VLTNYDDHQNLVGAAARIKHNGDRRRNELASQLRIAKDDDGKQITDLRTQCAVKDGINQTLQKQNRDEQVLIGECQTEAIKRLVPEPLKMSAAFFDNTDPRNPQAKYATRWLVLTNKPMSPFKVDVICNVPVSAVRMETVGSRNVSQRVDMVNPFQYLAIQDSPAFSPSSPLLFTVDSEGVVSCNFNPHP
jgi:hypothetical protein